MPLNYNDFHTFDQLYKMRQYEMDKAIRSGRYVKHDAELTRTHRKFAAPLLHLMMPLRWIKR